MFSNQKQKSEKVKMFGSLPDIGITGWNETKIIGIYVRLQWRYDNLALILKKKKDKFSVVKSQ